MTMSPEQRLKHVADVEAAVEAWVINDFNTAAAARELGAKRRTISDRIAAAPHMGIVPSKEAPAATAVESPEIPPSTLPAPELVDRMKRQYRQLAAHEAAKKWATYRVKCDLPMAINWFGDPHVDDNGCNWPLLDAHMKIVSETPGMFGGNIGDSGNNWGGRLEKLWADQDTSKATARELVRYLMAGVPWLVWLAGNHDMMDAQFADWMRATGGHIIPMYDWKAQFVLRFPNGRECRIDARHNFKGNSQWNTLHGLQKAMHLKDMAHLYVAGHTHNWALHQEESASRGFTSWQARTRGYKHIDDYGDYDHQKEGSSIVSVIDPQATTSSGFVQCFAETEAGAEYLTWLRSKRGER